MSLKVKMLSIGAAVLAAMGVSRSATANPFVNVSIQAQDPADSTFKNSISVTAGTTYNFRVVATLAPAGTTNANAGGGATAISTRTAGTDGINSLPFFDIFENAAASLQASILSSSLSTAPDNYTAGSGTTAGTTTNRGTGNDLVGIRAVLGPSIYAGVNSSVVLTGTFSVPGNTASNASGILNGRYNSSSGNLRINNGANTFFATSTTESSADPFIGFTPLVVSVPEPASMGFLGLSAMGLLSARRRRQIA